MELPGHVGTALLAYSPIAFVPLGMGAPRLALAGAAVSVVLAALPDVDLYGPRMNHSGYSHTVWFAVVVGAACALAFTAGGDHVIALSAPALGAFGFAVGTTAVLSHVAVDALTPMGIAPLAPVVRRRFSLGVTRSADPVANRRLLLLGLVAAAATAALGTAVAPAVA